ncbi:hypothetical protein WJX75_007317 [Coccomyxa subellipsoidea]|uniref:RNI-like protein n=1 Tax=Coccomyxa subellipsoidea TaxID=248742 RepID=A0ABR2Z152_9CHLO
MSKALHFIYAALLLAAASRCVKVADGAKKRTVHLVFSNHLDIGFDGISPLIGTDNNVVNVYFDLYFPKAIAVDEVLRKRDGHQRLKYLTHSWLISMFLYCPPGLGFHCPSAAAKKAVENAIREGVIYWHAFPFNAQLEMMDEPLIRSSVHMTHSLDKRFGYLPKMTLSQRDVPGFTRNAIPILTAEGIKAVTIGVNGGSAPPGVPKNTPFIWRDKPSGTEILTVLHPGGYSGEPVDGLGECVTVEGFDDVLCMAWKSDNAGPHDVGEVLNVFNITETNFPEADVHVSTLDAFFGALVDAAPHLNLSVVTGEIGDSWIYGVASDAVKVAEYRAVLRMRRSLLQQGAWQSSKGWKAYQNFSRILSKVGEHTWGLDVKTFLGDYANWDNKGFHELVEAGAWNYRRMIDAWNRQRAYVGWAIEALKGTPEGEVMEKGMAELAALQRPPSINDTFTRLTPDSKLSFESHAWLITLDPATGALAGLQRKYAAKLGVQWAATGQPLGQFLYSAYTEKDYEVIWDEYLYISRDNWWVDMDFGKANCSAAHPRRADVAPSLQDVWVAEENGSLHLVARSTLPRWAVREAGAPAEVWLDIQSAAGSDDLSYDVIWVNKTATRLPEAAWVRFAPDTNAANSSSWQMFKLGRPISPLEVTYNGSYSQHAVSEEGILVTGAGNNAWEQLNVRTLDAALVSPGEPTPFPNVRHAPDLTKGVAFNLANNIWGKWNVRLQAGSDTMSLTMSFQERVRDLKCLLGKLLPRTVSKSRNSLEEPCEQGSHSKYRRRTRAKLHQRDPNVPLLDLAVRAVAARLHHYDLDSLPADLAQLVLDELIYTASLDEEGLALFRRQHIYDLKLSDCSGVEDGWLRHLARSPLQNVSLAACSEISDIGVGHLAHHWRLIRLDLSHCPLITNDGLQHVKGLTNLRDLSLERCEGLSSLSALTDMSKLTSLNLKGCSGVSGLRHLSGLKQLEDLDMGWCSGITDADVKALASLTAITGLQLSRTLVADSGIFALRSLSRLQCLGLAGCSGISNGAVGSVSALTSLEELNLEWCTVSVKGLSHLSTLTKLTSLNVAYTTAGDGALAAWTSLTNLRTLNLDSCPVSDRGLQHISELTNLEDVNLSDTAITDQGMLAIAPLKGMQRLNLSYTAGVGDLGLATVARLTAMTELHLDGRSFTDIGLRTIAPLTRLRHLDLFGARITDAGCVHLRPFRQLERLEICGGGVSDEGVKELMWLTGLQHLSLAQNSRITDRASLFLSGLLQIRDLNLTGTQLTGNGILPLRSLTNLESLCLKRTRVKQTAADRLRPLLPLIHNLNC